MNENFKFNRILVIDDNESIHKDFQKIFAAEEQDSDFADLDAELFGDATAAPVATLAATDFELDFASQGKQGFEMLKLEHEKGQPFAMAFVDMRMPPGWDGVETIEHLWQADPDLQVVICTAYSDRSWDEIFDRLGQTDKLLILKKPFDEIEVSQLANSLCEKRRLLHESRKQVESLEQTVDQQEIEIKVAHQDAEQLIDSMSSILISVDEQQSVSRWNPVAESTFGIAAEQAVGRDLKSLGIQWCSPEDLTQLLGSKSEHDGRNSELQFVDDAGVTHSLDTRVSDIGNGSQSKLILAADVTHQKNLQAQLDQAQRLESVGQLAAGVAHEINTPMQYIGDNVRYVSKSLSKLDSLLNCLPALVDEDVSDEQLIELRKSLTDVPKLKRIKSSLEQIPEALADSIEGVESVSKIVAAMKEFSHPGNEEKSAVCMNHILESTITVAKNEWKYVADVVTEFAGDLPSVPALPSELNQAFLNLVVNASHAIGDRVNAGDFAKGKIVISTSDGEEWVEITIEDTGGGIPAAARERVFEPFFTTKDVGKGTGQGLAIAHSVVTQKHGGQIWFDVEEGVGTTFTLRIPKIAKGQSEQSGDVPQNAETQLN